MRKGNRKKHSATIKGDNLCLYIVLFLFLSPSFSIAGPTKRYVRPAPPAAETKSEVQILTPVPPVPNDSMGGVTLDAFDAEFLQNKSLVHVKGRVTNISNSFIRGHLTLHILSGSGTSIFASDLPLNNHQPFSNGESVTFDTTLNVATIKNASKVSLDFTRD